MGPGEHDHTPNAARETITRIQTPEPGVPLQIPGQYTRRTASPARPTRVFPGGLPAGAAQEERAREGGGAPRYRTPGAPVGVGTRLFNWLLRTA